MTHEQNGKEVRFSIKLDRVVRIMEFLSASDNWWHHTEVRKIVCPEFGRATVERDFVQLSEMGFVEFDKRNNTVRWISPKRFLKEKDANQNVK